MEWHQAPHHRTIPPAFQLQKCDWCKHTKGRANVAYLRWFTPANARDQCLGQLEFQPQQRRCQIGEGPVTVAVHANLVACRRHFAHKRSRRRDFLANKKERCHSIIFVERAKNVGNIADAWAIVKRQSDLGALRVAHPKRGRKTFLEKSMSFVQHLVIAVGTLLFQLVHDFIVPLKAGKHPAFSIRPE